MKNLNKNSEMYIFSNIVDAVQSKEYNYHVISDNEVHSFTLLSDAKKDKEQAERQGIEVELVGQDKAIVKFSVQI